MAHTVDVILIRHAQSQWNAENRFSGWADPPLTDAGRQEAVEAGKLLQKHSFGFDKVYTSVLQRAGETAHIILEQMPGQTPPVEACWQLNERHYGTLQGLNKAEMADEVGEDLVWRWRRSFKELPPPLDYDDVRHPRFDERYSFIEPKYLPCSENLEITRNRVLSFWNKRIIPHIKQQDRLLISSHGNTLRALLMGLTDMSVEKVESFEIPTGTPILCHFDSEARCLSWEYMEN